jgi:predicted phosphoadenosine phosphosulfate sulfurtransferase
MKYLLIIVAAFATSFSSGKHEFYVSITELNIKNDTLQIAIKVFTHDFEEVLKETNQQAIFLDHTSDSDKTMRHIKDYCSDRFKILSATKPYEITWIGHEFKQDVTWVYAYTILDHNSKMLFVKNELLSGHFHDQHNMVHFKNDKTTQSELCTKDKPEVRFIIKN